MEGTKEKKWRYLPAREDFSSSVLVFLVALPLCLGISLASGAPLFSGLLTGIVGGIMVGLLSRSQLSVAGPAAGMSVIVLNSIETLGGFTPFLMALVLAGVIQYLLGALRFGHMGHFVPSSVIKGVMASIGLILILKQIPHGLGYDKGHEGEDSFFGEDALLTTHKSESTVTEILHAIQQPSPTAILIFLTGLGVLIAFQHPTFQRLRVARFLPSSLVVVVLGVLLNVLFSVAMPAWELTGRHLVNIPSLLSAEEAKTFMLPDFGALSQLKTYQIALVIALVGSVETLVSMEAIEKIDPYRRVVSLNHELKVQGLANTSLGFIGGIPLTSVIVRSSANISAGARSKLSATMHGAWLLLSVLFLSQFINHIPLASLASILVIVSYKLTRPAIYKEIFAKGWNQFLPFLITIIAIFLTDLLVGMIIGLVVGIVFVIRADFHNSIVTTRDKKNYLVKLAKDVSFLNKRLLRQTLYSIPNSSYVIIDGTKPTFIDDDIIETIEDYRQSAPSQNITVEIKTSPISANEYFREV